MAQTIKYVRSDAAGGGDGSANNSSDAWTLVEAYANATAGTEVRIINTGTYTLTGNVTATNNGTSSAPIQMKGRNIDDTDYENIYINQQSYYMGSYSRDYWSFHFIDSYSTNVNYNFISGSSSSDKTTFYYCRIKNGNTSSTTGLCRCIAGHQNISNAYYYCYFENVNTVSPNASIMGGGYYNTLVGCKIVFSNIGVVESSTGFGRVYDNNIFIGSGENSIGITGGSGTNNTLVNNTFYNMGQSIIFSDWQSNANYIPPIVCNNLFHSIFTSNPSDPGYCIFAQNINFMPYIMHNRYYNCDYFTNFTSQDIDNEELSEDPCSDVESGDFTLNSVSGGGLSCKDQNIYPAFTWEWTH